MLAVGDEDFAVVSAEIDDDGARWRARGGTTSDRPCATPGSTSGPARASKAWRPTGTGRSVLLQEEQARLLVFAPDLSRLLHTLVLAVPADDPVLNPAWRREPNSRGEGLLLLRRGHVLIAKERDAPCLIEFGPPGDRPTGVTPDTVLPPNEPFQRPDATKTELVPLAVWPLSAATARTLPTINDLALGPDGRVYALSSHAQVIARMEQRLTPGERGRRDRRLADRRRNTRRPRRAARGPDVPPLRPARHRHRHQAAHDNLVVLQALDGL